jgi:glycosyltransferase involved in cell wall biosynthesis
MNNIKISILIATYNQPEFILQAVNSCLKQDYNNLEIIISDDSLNNITELLLLDLVSTGKVIYYKNDKNIGRVANYRKLLYEYSSGDWVVFLDGDDYYIDYCFFSEVHQMISLYKNIVMVSAGHIKLNEIDGSKETDIITGEDRVLRGDRFFLDFIKMPQHTTNVYCRRIAVDLDFYRHPSNASDAESLYRLVLKGDVVFLKSTPVIWRIHINNTTYHRNFFLQIKELDFIDSIYRFSIDFITKQEAQLWRKRYYSGMFHHLNSIAYSSNSFFKVFYVSLKAFKYWKYYSFINMFIFIKKRNRMIRNIVKNIKKY